MGISNSNTANQRDSWLAEKRSAYLYRKLAENTSGHEKVLFNQLANEADEQAEIWAKTILSAGDRIPFSFVNWMFGHA